MKIILASQSPSRKRLLEKIGLDFEVFPPNISEEKFINPKEPTNSCLHIAEQKALKAHSHYSEDIIIACDQMVYCKGEMFGKAYTKQKAIQTLSHLQGKSHELISGLCMLFKDKKHTYSCKSKMTMRNLTQEQIKSYILKEQPLKSAGSYHIEGEGLKLFTKIETEDFNAVEGLPLIYIVHQLEKWSYPLFENES